MRQPHLLSMAKRNSSGRRPASAAQPETLLFGRVTAGHGRHYVVTLDTGEQLVAHRRGKKGDVAVGDRVGCTPPVSGIAALETVDDRRTLLYRSDEWPRPPLNPGLIWNALLAAHHAGIPAVVFRNKLVLSDGRTAADQQTALLRSIGAQTIEISASERPDEARTKLLEVFTGKTVLLVGQSGMGKSTILTLLVPEANAQPRAFSEARDRGMQPLNGRVPSSTHRVFRSSGSLICRFQTFFAPCLTSPSTPSAVASSTAAISMNPAAASKQHLRPV